MTALLYGLIILLATCLGAITGAGGGAIIKPVFDLIGIDNASTIGVYSTVAVFSMCLSSLYKHSKSGQGFNKITMLLLAGGSLIGGYFGDRIFKALTQSFPNNRVTMIQAILLFLVLLAVLLFTIFKEYLPSLAIKAKPAIFGFGLAVGTLSVFLGIGGGPLNVIVLLGFMSMTVKESTPYSIGMIFFAQIPKLLAIFGARSDTIFDLSLFPIIAVTAILGGYLGTQINHLLSEKQVTLMYRLMILGLLAICSFNIITNI